MKHEYSNEKLSYFFKPRIHANVFAWNKPAPKPERRKQVTETIQRWEDDGGPVSETGTQRPQVPETNAAGQMDTGPGTG